MEIKSTPWPRLAPWLVLLGAAFAAGRWHAQATRTAVPSPAPTARTASASTTTGSEEAPFTSLDEIITATRAWPRPEARIALFFEKLSADDAASISAQLRAMPAETQRDALFLQAIRRWAELAPSTVLAHANTLENLPLRAEARAVIYEAWGRRDPSVACDKALAETKDGDRDRALAALLAGAASASAAETIALWERTPALFRNSPAGEAALDRIAEATGSAGQRADLQARIASLTPADERMRWSAAVAREWGRHEPEAAVAWIKTIAPAGATQDALVDEVFSAFVRRDPVRAAIWAARQADERRRSNYVAAAVAEWTTYDSAGAETWVNEQEEGIYLDGATSAIAAHFIEHRLWPQAFAWTRRVLRNEARADLLGNLGRIWNAERPEEFTTFLAQTSLNRAELEMLRSKIVEVASP